VLTDTHAHIDFDDFDRDRDEVIARAKDVGIERIIIPGVDLATSAKAVELAGQYDIVNAAVGIHPNSTAEAAPGDMLEISRLAERDRVVAVGEIGLDYYRDRAPKDIQARACRGQLELAQELKLPVIIHFRNVGMEGVELVGEDLFRSLRGVFHCFGGSVEFARELVSWGYYIGFDGPLTYKNSDRVDVARAVALENILIETDAPFLTPQSRRGKRNEPSYVLEIAEKLAEVKGIDVDEVIRVTGENARSLFGF